MAISIKTNIASVEAQRNLTTTQRDLNTALSHLSSGYRITKAGDDAAGLGISENLRAQIGGLNQAQRNANDGVSVIQTAEGGMNEVSNMLIRMRELAVQASSDGVGATERGYIDTEFQALTKEIDRISATTEFNGTKLINGNLATTGLDFQIGIRNAATDRISVTVANVSSTALGITAGTDVTTKVNAQNVLTTLDTALNNLSAQRASLGAIGNRLNSTIDNLGIASENL
jgi:flagellin